jgi:hypothetical protein
MRRSEAVQNVGQSIGKVGVATGNSSLLGAITEIAICHGMPGERMFQACINV